METDRMRRGAHQVIELSVELRKGCFVIIIIIIIVTIIVLITNRRRHGRGPSARRRGRDGALATMQQRFRV